MLTDIAIAMGLYLAPMGILIGVMKIAKWIHTPKDRRNPLTSDLLRVPGHSVQAELDDVQSDMATLMAATVAVPLLAYTEFRAQPPWPNWAILAVAMSVGFMYLVWRVSHLVRKARDLRLGLDAEMAVGQELATLMHEGFWVFHDLKGDGAYNVDHVVVGKQGVFAVETKGRAKRVREGGDGHKVALHNGRLEFPGWTETKPLEQARRNATWLSKWLSSAIGEPVRAQPVLALPGWYIERKSRDEVAVINAKSPEGYFTKARSSELTDKQVQQIRHQLEARCRDVPARAYTDKQETR